ncbi:hypothetical protein OEZ85_004276 [Tetradesmus obliquus]|uniref:Uncharacterized protein n=1 Tax=Tetradesmus obliquus TaxID=3088 RepID=A0ABY8UML8_TETOB|nr:hypothetical protein OEZ85_004276 [Tetradesmus obliquus]
MLQRQLQSSSSSLYHSAPQQQQQQQQQGGLQLELLQQLAYQLAESAGSTHPCNVAQGMWGIAKLYQLAQPAAAAALAQDAPDVQQQQQQQQAKQQSLGSSSSSGQQVLGQHWQPCRVALLRCAGALQQRQALSTLDCKHLALMAWGLVLAGGDATQPQQQQQQQQEGRSSSFVDSRSSGSRCSSSSSSSNSSSSSSFRVPHQFVQQMLDASRPSLAAADPHSQALLLCAAVQLQLQPSWQWLLGFYEATAPQLNHSTAQDLSMMAAALVQLQWQHRAGV